MKNKVETQELKDKRDMNFAMRLSLLVSIFLFGIKGFAYYLTDSAAVFSDAAESLIHIFVVGFATYSMWLSFKPADDNHPYGHEKIAFFSAGFEGALIMFAAFYIIYESLHRIQSVHETDNFSYGGLLLSFAVVLNLLLGVYLVRLGRKHYSIVLEANGKHILTDCWTSLGAIVALTMVTLTGIQLFDPIVAMIIAAGILWTGLKLVKRSISGLMDQVDESLHRKINRILEKETKERNLTFHHLRERSLGHRLLVEFHLLFPSDVRILKAHELASQVESALKQSLELPCDIMTHLEPQKDHDKIHKKYGLPI